MFHASIYVWTLSVFSPNKLLFCKLVQKKVDNFVVLARILSLFLEQQPKNMMALPTA